jgi:hypothetical protein
MFVLAASAGPDPMLYETVYDFARDEYWAGFYMRCAAGMLVIAVLLWFGLSSKDDSGPNDLRLLGWFALAAFAPCSVFAWYDHNSYHRVLEQQRGLEVGPITKITQVGGVRDALHVCIAASCFSGPKTMLSVGSTLRIGCSVRLSHVERDIASVAFSLGITSKIISIDLDKASCPAQKPISTPVPKNDRTATADTETSTGRARWAGPMQFETVYDFARDELPAGGYMRFAVIVIIIVAVMWIVFTTPADWGRSELSALGRFAGGTMLLATIVTLQSDYAYQRTLSQNTNTIEGAIYDLGYTGSGRYKRFMFCLPDGCFHGSEADSVVSGSNPAKNDDYAVVRYTYGTKSWLPPFRRGTQVINIAVAKRERVTSRVSKAE